MTHRVSLDIGASPELLRLAEEVRVANEPLILQRNGEDLAVVMPIHPKRKRAAKQAKPALDFAAFEAAAGGWSDVDTDRLLADVYADRERGDRPSVEL